MWSGGFKGCMFERFYFKISGTQNLEIILKSSWISGGLTAAHLNVWMIVFLIGFWSVEALVGKVILEVSAGRPCLASMRHECPRHFIWEHKFNVFLIVLEILNRAWPFFPTTLKRLTYTFCWQRILLSSSDKFSALACKSGNNNDMWLRVGLSLRMIISMLEWQVQCFGMQLQKR